MSESSIENENKLEKESEIYVNIRDIRLDTSIEKMLFVDVEITDYLLIIKNIVVKKEENATNDALNISIPRVWHAGGGDFETVEFGVDKHERKVFSEIYMFIYKNKFLMEFLKNGWCNSDV